MSSALRKHLLSAPTPSTAAGFINDSFSVVDLRRGRGGFSLASSAVTHLPPELLTPSFDAQNIHNPGEMADIVRQTVEAAGLGRKKRWSLALPEGAARSFVISLESKPANRRELIEILNWKIERLIAIPPSELRVSRQRMSSVAGQERYMVTVTRDEVISEYEAICDEVGWHTGLLLPRHLGEAQWLLWDRSPGDKMLVSATRSGFTSLIVRNGEPALVRSYECEPDSVADELHRFALYYRDRVAGSNGGADLTKLLVIGHLDIDGALQAVGDALDSHPQTINPESFGFELQGEPIHFDQLAGAAGLASLGWQ